MNKKRYGFWEILRSMRVDFEIFNEKEESKNPFFKGNDIFAFMLNNDVTKMTFDQDTETISIVNNEEEKYLIHQLNREEFKNLILFVKDKALLDLSNKIGEQKNSFYPLFGNYKSKEKFYIEQNNNKITVEILNSHFQNNRLIAFMLNNKIDLAHLYETELKLTYFKDGNEKPIEELLDKDEHSKLYTYSLRDVIVKFRSEPELSSVETDIVFCGYNTGRKMKVSKKIEENTNNKYFEFKITK